MKKAQSISINTIIVAAIALVVMILVIMIFANAIGNFRRNSGECVQQSGRCVDKTNSDMYDSYCKAPNGKERIDLVCYNTKKEVDTGKVCCVST